MTMSDTYYSVMPSPVGPLTLAWSEGALSGIFFERARPLGRSADWIRDDRRLARARQQLDEYFAGERTAFDLPLNLRGTPFQRRVWEALIEIPFGTTLSYGTLARSLDKPKAMRAVGAANGQNQFVIVIPCHRVIGADGSLTGFGGGLPRKQWLLALERSVALTGVPPRHSVGDFTGESTLVP
jgi:methylated-DNA-[protein]-cysteine S-methyltransferase